MGIPSGEVELLSAADAGNARLPLVVRVVNTLLTDALRAEASDVYVEPSGAELVVQFRVAGQMVDALRLPPHLKAPTVARLKVIGHLEMGIRDEPQQGTSRLRWEDNWIDLQVSTTPTDLGESVRIQLASDAPMAAGLDEMHMSSRVLGGLEKQLRAPQGMVVVAGPEGSGLSGVLRAALRHAVASGRKAAAISRGNEPAIDGVARFSVASTPDKTPLALLRDALRQRAEVVMLDEPLDRDTAHAAVEAAQTGHLVLARLAADDAVAAIGHLVDLGVEPYQVSLGVIAILAQRLARQICPACGVSRAPSPESVAAARLTPDLLSSGTWKAGAGCSKCLDTGHRGRVAIHELLELTDDLRSLISGRAPDHLIRVSALRHGLVPLAEDGVAKAAAGLVTLEDVLRVAPRHDEGSAGPSGAAASGTVVDTRKSVLILEDDPDTQALLRLILDGAGYRTTVAGDGVDALLELGRSKFDLILSDINMPNLDGMALAEMKSRKGIATPLIFLTAEEGPDVEEQCLALGARDFIRKPLKKDVLLLRIRRVFA